MFVRHTLLSLVAGWIIVGIACLAWPGEGQAQDNPKQQPAPKKQKTAPLTEEMKLEEANAIRQAFILLAGCNHDYNGRRAKAMQELKHGVKLLDDSIRAHGTQAQKTATAKGEATVRAAEKTAEGTVMLHEPQPTSDAVMRDAGAALEKVLPTLAEHNQQKVLGHVERAMHEIHTALKIR